MAVISNDTGKTLGLDKRMANIGPNNLRLGQTSGRKSKTGLRTFLSP